VSARGAAESFDPSCQSVRRRLAVIHDMTKRIEQRRANYQLALNSCAVVRIRPVQAGPAKDGSQQI